MSDQPGQQQINIELGEKEAEGIYSNLAIIYAFAGRVCCGFYTSTPSSEGKGSCSHCDDTAAYEDAA